MDETLIQQQEENRNDKNLNDNTRSFSKGEKRSKLTLRNLSKEQRDLLLSGGIGLAGILAGAGAFSVMSMKDGESVPTPTPEPESGPISSITSSEPDLESDSEKIVVYTHAPVAHSVTDDMPFGKAFATARNEVGPGGVFEWNGKIYGTYYKDEWDKMTDEDKELYRQSLDSKSTYIDKDDSESEEDHDHDVVDVDHEDKHDENEQDDDSHSNHVTIDSDHDGGSNQDVVVEVEQTEYTVYVSEGFDLSGDGTNDVYLTDVNGNELPDVMIDTDGDGAVDAIVFDISPEDGITGNEVIVSIDPIDVDDIHNGNEIVVSIDDNYLDDDPTISNEDIADNTFDNDVDMNDYHSNA